MQFIYDHLNAVLIGGIAILILAQLAIDRQGAQVNATRYQAGLVHMNDLVEMIEHDFHNIGSGISPADSMIVAYKWDQSGKYFEFRTASDTTGVIIKQIRYELAKTRDIPVKSDSVKTVQGYELRRYELKSGSYTLTGKSMDTVTDLTISLYRAGGGTIGSDLNKAREVVIQMTALSPLGEDQLVRRNHWNARFYPTSLSLKDL